ncbi:MAG TPA: MlaD family protein [Solirubrobacteraceae bacterium]|jgi:ABC-type transporter Mla subunit MlaD|nr:MlaD family protein [Solirubrobacteraceae bacterium]
MSDPAPPLKLRRHKPRVSNLHAAIAGLVGVVIACYLVFGGGLPFGGSGFELKAVFTSNTDLHIPSPVRIAGVDVGQVTAVDRIKGSPNAGVVVMQIDRDGLPIHSDATAQIRSRILLEGNFYVALEPGTPEAPILNSGATLPAANTSGPVQLDRVLSSLDTNARANLQKLVQGFGAALNKPGADGTTGAQGLNRALDYSASSFEASSIVNQALLGEKPGDLTGAVRGESEVFRGLAEAGTQLPGLVSSFDATMSALASQQQNLGAAIAALPTVLRSTLGADSALEASFAPTETFARDLIPSIRQLGATVTVATPWLQQLAKLSSKGELGGLLQTLTPAVDNTAVAVKDTTPLIDGAATLSRCFSKVLVPTGDEQITVDSSPPAGLKVYEQLFQSAVGLAGSTQNFDGNGRYVRATVGGGATQVQTPPLADAGALYGNAVLPVLGTFPEFPSSAGAPAVKSSVPCYTQTAPDLNSAAKGTGP